MCCKGFFKRIVPFFLTFAVGLFIASFFVTITAPNLSFRGGKRHQQYHQMMEFENQRLNDENSRLRRQLEDTDRGNIKNLKYNYELDIPAVPLMPPPAPPAPPAPSVRMKTVPYSGR